MSTNIIVKVVYALQETQYLKSVILPKGSTIREAINLSGLLELCKEINLNENKVGVYNRQMKLTDKVKNNDRIEIYRPLISDPNEIRLKKLMIKK